MSESATEANSRENLVLAVDDDPKLLRLVQEVLTASGFEALHGMLEQLFTGLGVLVEVLAPEGERFAG